MLVRSADATGKVAAGVSVLGHVTFCVWISIFRLTADLTIWEAL
jgi:hypothetical protein